MILIADSGSTKTQWVLVDKDKIITSFKTKGFNPYFTNSTEIYNELKSFTPKEVDINNISNIYFYGAGCSTEEMNKIVFDGLRKFFTNSVIEVEHDLKAAARALFRKESGIAVILGTGANTCMYNGDDIIENIPSLGFILGDEGGGDYMGKLFITQLLYGNLSKTISDDFSKTFNLTKDEILNKVYKEPYPNRFLASFTKFILSHANDNQINSIIKKTFRDIFEIHICKYQGFKNYNIRVTGSVGHFFSNQLIEVAAEFDLKIDLIVKEPISRLVEFHM